MLLNFDEYCDQLVPIGALNSPAELHGMLCGRLSGGSRMGRTEWLKTAWEFLDLLDLEEVHISPELEDSVAGLYTGTLAQLSDDDMSFALLIPDDDTDIAQRLQALSQWCHGFLSGFGSSGLSGNQTFSPESAEALRDFAAIVQIGTDAEDTEQSEADFFEVSEYVRLAALNLFFEFGGQAEEKGPSDKIVH